MKQNKIQYICAIFVLLGNSLHHVAIKHSTLVQCPISETRDASGYRHAQTTRAQITDNTRTEYQWRHKINLGPTRTFLKFRRLYNLFGAFLCFPRFMRDSYDITQFLIQLSLDNRPQVEVSFPLV